MTMTGLHACLKLQTDLTQKMQQLARGNFFIASCSPLQAKGRGRAKRPLVLGPMCFAARPDPCEAIDDLVLQARRRDANAIYAFSMQELDDGWLVWGTPAIAGVESYRL